MKKRNDQNAIVKRAVLVFILMFLVLLAALAFFTRSIVMREQLKASYTAEATVANVEAQLNRYLAESELLKSIVESGYEISDSDFAALSKLMYDEDGIIKAVELAPNGVVRSVYPKASNADVLGRICSRHPERKVEASLAKESGSTRLPGRFSWCRAAPAHCLFDPIYTTGGDGSQKYWGFSVLVLDWESFLDEIQINKLQDASYEYLIWKEGHNGERIVIAQGDRPWDRTHWKLPAPCPTIPGILRYARPRAGSPRPRKPLMCFCCWCCPRWPQPATGSLNCAATRTPSTPPSWKRPHGRHRPPTLPKRGSFLI